LPSERIQKKYPLGCERRIQLARLRPSHTRHTQDCYTNE
jgi:hypothetical protein